MEMFVYFTPRGTVNDFNHHPPDPDRHHLIHRRPRTHPPHHHPRPGQIRLRPGHHQGHQKRPVHRPQYRHLSGQLHHPQRYCAAPARQRLFF